jgi:hypothetical protein
MKRAKILGLCLIAVLTGSAIASAVASAALPELGRCVKVVVPHTGTYKAANCVVLAGGTGSYNWEPGPGANKKFEGAGEVTTLETVGKQKIECGGSTFTGEYTGVKTETVTIDLINCADVKTKQFCQSNPVKEGEIETPLALEGELGFIVGGEKPRVGLDLKHSPNIVTFECGKLPETTIIHGTLEGSVISYVLPIDRMATEVKQSYKGKEGKQIPQQFEGGVKDTLTLTLISGLEKTTEESALKNKLVIDENEEPLEVKAK